MDKGLLIIISAPSGAGKGTVINSLLSKRNDTVVSISATTRNPRTGEKDGIHYYFKTRQDFEKLIENDQLLEYAEYNGNYYGTPVEPVDEWLNKGINVILEIDVQGALKVMKFREELISIFITAPSAEEFEKRLKKRGTESEEIIKQRLRVMEKELTKAVEYDYVVMNDKIENAVDKINDIIELNIKKR